MSQEFVVQSWFQDGDNNQLVRPDLDSAMTLARVNFTHGAVNVSVRVREVE